MEIPFLLFRTHCSDAGLLQAHQLHVQDHVRRHRGGDVPRTEAEEFRPAAPRSEPDGHLCVPCPAPWPVLLHHLCATSDWGAGSQEHLHSFLRVQGELSAWAGVIRSG